MSIMVHVTRAEIDDLIQTAEETEVQVSVAAPSKTFALGVADTLKWLFRDGPKPDPTVIE